MLKVICRSFYKDRLLTWKRFHPSPLSELKERKSRTDCARAAAMAVAGKTACGELGERARRKAERRSVGQSVRLYRFFPKYPDLTVQSSMH